MSRDWSTPDKDEAPAYRRRKPDGTWNSAIEKAHGNRVEGPQWQSTGARVAPPKDEK